MKTNTPRLGSGMPTVKHLGLAISFFTFLFSSIGSANCIKELSFRILEEKSHAIEAGTDINALSDIDLLRGKYAAQHSDVQLCIDEFGFITKTTTYTYAANSFYPNRIHQTVETPAGLKAYDDQGNLILDSPNDPQEIVNIPGLGVALTPAQIASFGLSLDFSAMISEYQSHFAIIGGSSWAVGNKNYFSSDELDIIISTGDQYMLTSNYDHDGNLLSMYLETGIERNGLIIPQNEVSFKYDALSNGARMQTTLKDTYLSYSVVENGQTIIQYFQAEHPHLIDLPKNNHEIRQTQLTTFELPQRIQPSLELFPNPTIDRLNVKLNASWSDHAAQWTIRSATGKVILSGVKEKKQLDLGIALPVLAPSIYLFQIQQNGNTFSNKFIIAQ